MKIQFSGRNANTVYYVLSNYNIMVSPMAIIMALNYIGAAPIGPRSKNRSSPDIFGPVPKSKLRKEKTCMNANQLINLEPLP